MNVEGNVECYLRTRIFQEDIRTGELVNELSLEENEVVNKAEARKKKEELEQRAKEYYKRRSPMEFVWVLYELSTNLMEELSAKYVAMLFYLATYYQYGGGLSTGKKPIYKKQLPELLRVSEKTAYRFWTAILHAGIGIEAANGELSLDEKCFQKGALPAKKKLAAMAGEDIYMARGYIKSIRHLYETAEPGARNYLGYLFQLLPFVNREYNIVCHNPLEAELDKIQPMNFGEVCTALGYDAENSSRLLRELLKLKFTAYGKTQGCVRYVITDSVSNRSTYKLFLNPNVLYSGSHTQEVEVLGKF